MQHSVLSAVADPVFQLQIPPEAAVLHPAWQHARAAALEGLFSGDAVVLLGQPGSGKTLLLKDLARTLRNAGQPVRLVERADDLDGPRGDAILLVDEADALGADALAALCAGPAPVLLSALPGSAERLAGHPVRRVVLDPLAPEDVARFVAARLAAAGRPRDLLEPEAVLALARHSGGLPRLVNVIAGAALFMAGWDGSPRVGLRHIEEAASMRDPSGEGMAMPLPAMPLPAMPLPDMPPAQLPSYTAHLMRRRVALGGMVAAAGVIFTLPWVARSRSAGQSPGAQAQGSSQAVQVAQADAASPSAAAAQAAGPQPGSPGASAPPAQPVLDAQPAAPAASAAAPPQAEAQRQHVPAPAMVADGRHGLAASDAAVLFQGPIFNETMGQGGHVSLAIRKRAQTGAITARFNASQGLVGSGTLAGSVSGTGRVSASGQLLMGRTSFMCDLNGALVGDTLTGSASFVRPSGGVTYHSRFSLVRA